MTAILDLILRFWRYILERLQAPYRTCTVQERLPSKIEKRMLYVVEEDGYEEQAAMLCPCGCGNILHMNLLPDERPYWTVTRHIGGIASLYPSVWRQVGCRSHFWFRRGRVSWCRPSLELGRGREGA